MKYSKFKKELKKEYDASFKEAPKRKLSIHIKLSPVYALAVCIVLFFGFFLVDGISTKIYNDKLDEAWYSMLCSFNDKLDDTSFVKIDSSDDIKKFHRKIHRSSLWDTVILGKRYSASGGSEGESSPFGGFGSNTGSDNSYYTNTQEKNIDEPDIAKCDGKYIYYAKDGYLYIYDLEGNCIVRQEISRAIRGLMIYEKSIVLIGDNEPIVYFFDGACITTKYSEDTLKRYVDSRISNGYLYYMTWESAYATDCFSSNCPVYYDGFTYADFIFELHRINLTTYETKTVGLASGRSQGIYMSDSYFVVASTTYGYSLLSVFDADLNPVALIKGYGSIVNQYCMDEEDDMLRFVLSERGENSISIFDLKNKTRIGFLNEGIGLENQTVRGVTFSGNTCYVCTYESHDPLYEIDLSDPTNPVIVSAYEAPGYSGYLYTWVYNDNEYVLGLGYTDSWDHKISIYQKMENGTIQLGKDFIFTWDSYADSDLYVKDLSHYLFDEGKELFVYSKENHLYLGASLSDSTYYLFDIELADHTATISVYKTFEITSETRCFLINGKLYLPQKDLLIIE